ncbi:hypothetical protein [Senegalia massiliensis]|uniref:Uncharacterized protein n=1 Tax=Senegalia massiliensis TaxID=1720316 RepID=A0A845QYL4_9CLOT|nr:hypothetical protein [Senegalia massiliensis]NBI07575.1 hypothetical protein [Senegalia massiliensis]
MKVINKNIEVICYFTSKGIPQPLRLRIEGEEQNHIVIKVDKIINRKLEKLAGNKMIIFTCQSIINNTLTLFELKYEVETCKWLLFKK